MIEQPVQPPKPLARVQISELPDGNFDIQLQNCVPPQALDMMLKAIRAVIFQKPQEARPQLLVPNGRPLPDFRRM